MSTEQPNEVREIIGQSSAERLRLAVKEYQDAMWAAESPASNTNYALRQWQDVSAVHGMIHPGHMAGKLKCPGPLEEVMGVDQKWCDLATLERASKDRVMAGMENLLGTGWAIHVTIERAVP